MHTKLTTLTHQAYIQVFLSILAVSTVTTLTAEESEEPIKLTLHPEAEPQPALKYRLLPEFIDRKPGNAAVYYGKVTAEQTAFFGSKEWRDKIYRWPEESLEKLLAEEARVPLDPYYLRQAALCDSCDWQLPLREGGYFEMLLPEVQQTRNFGRILASQARIQFAQGDFEEAIETFQTGLALGRNVASGEIIVGGLVGIANSNDMLFQIMEYVQQPGAPNLYWAASMLPRPFISMREALEVELSAFELSFPDMQEWKTKERDSEDWAEVLYAFCEYIAVFDEDNKLGRADELHLEIMDLYAEANEGLVESGRSIAEVEAMSKEQILALYLLGELQRWQQDISKYFHLPYPIAIEGMNAKLGRSQQTALHVFPQTERFGSVLVSARTSIARNERRFAVLRVVEALRIYAAAHDGKLPEELNDITEVPIPNDPVTGKAFQYQLEGEVAKLRGPAISGVPLNYEITMNKLDKP